MNVRKNLAAWKRRALPLLCAGIFLFSSCNALNLLEFREAAEGTSPVPAEATPEALPSAASPETEAPAPETLPETEAETEPPETEAPFRPSVPASERGIPAEAEQWIVNYESAFGEGSADEVMLTEEEIAAYNVRMTESCPTLTDISALPESVDGAALKERIASYAFPQGDKFDRGGSRIDDEMRNAVLANRALDAIGETVEVQPAVITARCDMRSFPTSLGFYDSGDTFYSRIQETELIVGMPVWVLHRSADGGFLYVRSYYYDGWIPFSAAAFCDRDTFLSFCDPEVFVTVTAPRVDAGHTNLDMGVVLPCVDETEDAYVAVLPMREAGGAYGESRVNIPKTDAYPGYLPYTMRNYYAQAFSYLGTQYGWGGADGGIDCSGFVCAVFRTFGIMLPRDTREQKDYAGEVTYTENLGAAEKDVILTALKAPSALFSPGHVMLYLGKGSDGVHYIIHAPKGGDYVKVAVFDPNRALTSVVTFR